MKKRNTIQGKLVLDAVNQLANHPTADDVYEYVSKLYPNISKGTVYRNLNSLSDEGLILKIEVPNSADRFDKTTYNHYHIRCLNCSKFEDVDVGYLDNINKEVESKTGYKILNHNIIFSGICSECLKKDN